MLPVADLVVYSPGGQIVLVVEAKALTGKSRAWATETRRNLLAQGTMPDSQFLLLALPDRFYLWNDAGNSSELVEPSYEIDAIPFLQPYYEKARLSPHNISSLSFDILITGWLNEFVYWGFPAGVPEETLKLLQDSGLREALKGGNVVVHVPA